MKVAQYLTAIHFVALILSTSAHAGSDIDGDGTDDLGCYDAAGNLGQPSGSWYFMTSSNGFATARFGYAGTTPIVGDFDGDGTDDFGCYDAAGNLGQRAGSWYFMNSTQGFIEKNFGYAGTVPIMNPINTAMVRSEPRLPESYESRVTYFKARYGKSAAWQNWMIANKARYANTFTASRDIPDIITISFRYETVPINYTPAWSSEAEHMAVFTTMAQGAYPGYGFNIVFNGNTSTSYANIIAGTAGTTSYSYGKNVYLYYETIFNHEFGHTMKLPHHYDTIAEVGNGSHMPPGDTECIMDRTSSLFCSGCRAALGISLDSIDTAAMDAAMNDILSRYP